MLGSRTDIIGDLYRLRMDLTRTSRSDIDDAPSDLELLAAMAIAFGMSHNIVIKASQVNRDQIDALLDYDLDHIRELAAIEGYEVQESGVVARHHHR